MPTPRKAAVAVPNTASQFHAKILSVDDRDGRTPAAVWMSEAVMLKAQVSAGQLVALSLPSPDSSTLGSLRSRCSKHFGIQARDADRNRLGSFLALAVALPSRKLVLDQLRLSKNVSNSMGCPDTGTSVCIFPLGLECSASGNGRLVTAPVAKAGAREATVQECTRLVLNWCAPDALAGNADAGNVYRKKIAAADFLMTPPRPVCGSVMAQSASAGEVSPLALGKPAWSALMEGGHQVRELLQSFALRWLSDRFLLPGSLVVLPICGCDCVFSVSALEDSSLSARGGPDGAHVTSFGVPNSEHSVSLESLPLADLPARAAVFHVVRTTTVVLGPLDVERTPDKEASVLKTPGQDEAFCADSKEVKFGALGGLSHEIQMLRDVVELPILQPELFSRYGLQPTRGVLLYGPSGTGKTSLARAVASEAGLPLFVVNGPEIIQEYYGGSEDALTAVFAAAENSAPSVVFIDELDAIAPERKDGNEEMAHRLVSSFLILMDGSAKNGKKQVTVIGATNRLEAIDPALRRPGRFDKEIEIGIPSPSGRLEILQILLKELRHSLSTEDIQSLATTTHGFVGADLRALCDEAAITALRRCVAESEDSARLRLETVSMVEEQLAGLSVSQESGFLPSCQPAKKSDGEIRESLSNAASCKSAANKMQVCPGDFAVAIRRVQPSAMREVMLEMPEVRWTDIGGHQSVKQQLKEMVEWPQKHSDAFARIGAHPPRGVMLYGPPGCSKTLMARAVAAEAGLNFLAVKGPELFSKWVGESEKAVCALFNRARAASPSIVFFDEIDGLVGDRDHEHGEVSVGSRVVSQLLVELDGLKPSNGVTVVAATNRPDRIDPALLRPGRFDRVLFVGPPDKVAREEIFDIHLRSVPCSPDVWVKDLASATNGYTGADIAAVCREASLSALEEDLTASQVSNRHFQAALRIVLPSALQDDGHLLKFQRGLPVRHSLND